ncbi:MAG: acetyl-CoA carboxylase biotin carboxyl carrier protein subunit [Verrucomicrobia bacterium]|nr:acetyl-CoA carboxylase biotin carboxyl carrier protein subunit [Verrucomicrobiota bacterium]
MTKLRVTLAGKSYDVVVDLMEEGAPPPAPPPPPRETAALSLGPAPHVLTAPPAGPGATAAGAVVCPIGGKVVSIDVKLGDPVTESAQVATIEAMKMNTYVYASLAGRVTAIEARPGDTVEEGAILLRLG